MVVIWFGVSRAGYILQLMQIYNSSPLLSSNTVARHLLYILALFIFNCSKYMICVQRYKYRVIKFSVHLMFKVQNNPHTTDDMKMPIAEYIRNINIAILNKVFVNTVRLVNKCLQTSGGQFEQYL